MSLVNYEPLSRKQWRDFITSASKLWPSVIEWQTRLGIPAFESVMDGWCAMAVLRGYQPAQLEQWLQRAISGLIPNGRFRPEDLMHHLCSTLPAHDIYRRWEQLGSVGTCPTEIVDTDDRRHLIQELFRSRNESTQGRFTREVIQNIQRANDQTEDDVDFGDYLGRETGSINHLPIADPGEGGFYSDGEVAL